MREPVIELEDVAIAFGDRRVLDGVNLQVLRGETTVIVGRSGSGKTVLLKLMMGLLAPDRGHVRVFGKDLATLSDVSLVETRKRMAMLFQSYALFDAISVEANVAFPLVASERMPARDADRLAHELVRLLGLEGSEHLLPAELSGGMRKRVGVARALVTRPEIVLFDEPTTGLDPILVERVDGMIALAKREYGITSVVISHDLASVRRLADQVAFLHAGKIVYRGDYRGFLHSELAPIRDFLSETTSHATRAPPPDGAPVIELAGVHKSFGDNHVLRGVDLAIHPRRITALIGGSGSGKSVLVKLVMGMLRPDAGSIRVFGRDIATMTEPELAAMRRDFGFVFQHAALLDWLSVEDNVAFPLVERDGEPAGAARERVDAILERLDLAGLARRLPAELSLGERKRVAIARAVVTRPKIVIYDEPTTGQDPQRAHEIDDLILSVQERFEVTSLVISHDMASTFRIANAIAMLHDGKIAAYGSPAELRISTSPHVRELLRASAFE